MSERDYVLGTHDEEIHRLGLQHLVWRPWMLSAWRRGGITLGSRVLDVGSGPGFATADLAELVGQSGEVLALERSGRFVSFARQRLQERQFAHARIEEVDLMSNEISADPFDAAWCRWVASFVSSPSALVAAVDRALKPGGVAIFHEYGDYASWRLMPPRPALDRFVGAVIASWRAAGGDPDVGLVLPALLRERGFRVRDIRPLVFVVQPSDVVWQWPAAFLRSGAARLRELGQLDPADAGTIVDDFGRAERDPSTMMMTPLVLEIIADKPPAHRG